MTDRVRIWIATAITALFLASASVAGLIAHGARPAASQTAVAQVAGAQSSPPSSPVAAQHPLDDNND
ncbi:MAG: hypothetical protein ACYCXW_19465 [Solirubrobacteraceae bacterium]